MCISKQHTGIIWTDLSLCKDNIRPADHVTYLLNTPDFSATVSNPAILTRLTKTVKPFVEFRWLLTINRWK